MIPAPTPPNELARLAALLRTKLLDSQAEPGFSAITRCVTQAALAPMAVISLVDAKRQWFFCKIGIAAQETPREISFCGHAIADTKPLVIADALLDERFADNPLVLGPPHVRAYVGAPLLTPEGLALGTLCAIDHQPRSWRPNEIAAVSELATITSALIQSRAVKHDLGELFQACASLCETKAA